MYCLSPIPPMTKFDLRVSIGRNCRIGNFCRCRAQTLPLHIFASKSLGSGCWRRGLHQIRSFFGIFVGVRGLTCFFLRLARHLQ